MVGGVPLSLWRASDPSDAALPAGVLRAAGRYVVRAMLLARRRPKGNGMLRAASCSALVRHSGTSCGPRSALAIAVRGFPDGRMQM